MQPERKKRRPFVEDLVSLWPGLRYLSLGIWLAWAFLAYSGTIWLSDVEINGSNISAMYIISTASFAVVSLIAPFFRRHIEMILASRKFIIYAGLLTTIGALGIIAAGPYYLGIPWLFYTGAALTGIGTAIIALKCGEIYGQLKPQKALVYTALSQIIVVIIYFTVLGSESFQPIPGGPSLAGIISLLLLPLVAAILVSVKPASSKQIESSSSKLPETSYFSDLRSLSAVFWKFLIAVFIFTTVSSVINGLVVSSSLPSSTISSSNNLMLLRILMAGIFLFLALRIFKQINFGKIYLLMMALIAILVAANSLLDLMGISFQIVIGFVSGTFDFVVWCLLAFIVFQRRISSITVFGFGRGVFMVGSALGWYLGAQLMPLLSDSYTTAIVYIAFAVLILLCATLIFSEKDFDCLVSPITEAELTLKDIAPNDNSLIDSEDDEHHNHARPFTEACNRIGASARLSTREQDIFELLALGRGSVNVAKRLNISLNTARTHTHNIYTKLNVHSRQELIELVEDERQKLQEC